jgi:FkbH-like protein
MFDLMWSDDTSWRSKGEDALIPPAPPDPGISAVALLLWEEHCVECAIPHCYTTCRLYVPRRDQKCARFEFGIVPNPNVRGLFDYGADISFRRWGKLEAKWHGMPRVETVERARMLARGDRSLLRPVNAVGSLLQPVNPRRRVNGAYALARERWLARRFVGDSAKGADAFFAKFFVPGDRELSLQLELHQERPVYRTTLRAVPGWNECLIPLADFGADLTQLGRLLLSLGNDEAARIIFTWLDVVALEEESAPKRPMSPTGAEHGSARPSEKVKCVVWDLDNTLWKGVIGDDGAAGVVPDARVLALIRALDERGIVQSVASKNTYDIAWPKIVELGLQDYFLYPAIHWGAKSGSLRAIADELNINIDTFAFIDDSPFERAEVESALPQVRVFDAVELDTLLTRPEFDVLVTEASRTRRQSYLIEASRKRVASSWKDDINGFLRSCNLVMRIGAPEPEQRTRCLELLQRTNQLNLSSRRYSEAEFSALLDDSTTECFAIHCRDRFGDYGLVGFAVADISEDRPRLVDFVLSCRVAQKRVEETFLCWYGQRAQRRGALGVTARFVPTERNAPLREAMSAIDFDVTRCDDGSHLLVWTFEGAVVLPDVVEVEEAECRV